MSSDTSMIRSPASAFNKKEMRNLPIFGVGWGAGLREPEGGFDVRNPFSCGLSREGTTEKLR
jgi:hypothetical protein